MTGYDFSTLSSGDFELLACDVLNAALGLALSGFPAGRDGGIDLRCVTHDGFTTVVQCKHYRGSSTSTFMRAVAKESNKKAMKSAGRYIFITSHPLTPDREIEVAALLGIAVGDVWGPDKINRVLRDHAEIELRHFKLWLHSTAVLKRFMQAGLWNRTEALLDEVAHQARYWVEIPAYQRVRGILDEHGTCVIAGGPGVGKSFLAERIMLQGLGDGWQVVDATDASESLWDLAESDVRRLLYVDDFLGEAALRQDAADTARVLSTFISYVGRHKDRLRLVMTTREQVLAQAAHTGGERLRALSAPPFLYTLAVAGLDEATRVEILLSHIHQSDLADAVRTELADDNRLRTLAGHPSFSPRLIRGVLNDGRMSTSSADDVLNMLTTAFVDPAALWRASFDALDSLAQRMLLGLATFPGRTLPYRELMDVATSGHDVLTCMQSFRMLEPAWVRVVGPPTGRSVAFAHPGCRDFLVGMLEQREGVLARDIINAGLHRLEQVVALSQAGGLFTASGATPLPPGPTPRPVLCSVLMEHRMLLASRLEGFWHEAKARAAGAAGTMLLRLRDAAALAACYGDEHDADWVAREAEALLVEGSAGLTSCVPAIPAFALARTLFTLSRRAGGTGAIGTARRLAAAGLANASGLPDLDAYEDLPDALHTPETRNIAVIHAAHIIEGELDHLRHEGVDVADLSLIVRDLAARAAWYALEFDFGDLLDLIEEQGGVGAAADR